MFTGNKQINALTVIDEILRLLSREGSGREVVCSFKDRVPTWCNNIKLRKLLGIEQKATRPTDWIITKGVSIIEALYLTRSVLEVLNDAIPKFGIFPIEDQLGLYVQARMWASSKFLSYSKYITVWPFAKYLHQDLPEKPEGFPCHPLVFSGAVRRLLKARLVSKNDTSARLFWGYLQGVKRACARANDGDIIGSMLKHHSTLVSAPTTPMSMLEELRPYAKRSLVSFSAPKEPKLYEASTSASYYSKRSLGGQREDVRGDIRNMRCDLGQENTGVVGLAIKKEAKVEWDSVTGIPTLKPAIVEKIEGQIPPTFDEVLNLAYNQPENECLHKFNTEPPRVQVSAVLEPLKIRLISKGNALNYYVSKFFQKAMWEYLQKYPQFVLTGRVMNQSDLHGFIEREENLGLHFDHWVSGDYSAATDNVDIRMTMMIFEMMLGKTKYSERLKDVLRLVIGPQTINYPVKKGAKGYTEGLEPFVQKNGQLMGSPLSFPILCLINLVVYWKALEEYSGMDISIENLPVLINGDDILFRANEQFYGIWKSWVAKVGFKLSLGKNYFSKNYLTINSKLFRHRGGNDFKLLGYLNVGLLTGQSKHGSDGSTKTIYDMYNVCIQGCINPERTKKRFFHYQKDDISKFTVDGTFNAFIPRERGGLGFELYPGQCNRLTSFQKRFATLLDQELDEALKSNNTKILDKCNNMIGIIDDAGTKRKITCERDTNFIKGPKIGPLEDRIVEYEKDEYNGPILANQMICEKPLLRVKNSWRLIKKIRSAQKVGSSIKKMRKNEIYSYPIRICEAVSSKKRMVTLERPELILGALSVLERGCTLVF